jgi:hypothetical protein
MKYREALQVGTEAEGTIQCTYATIYDKDGHALFSLQRKRFQDTEVYREMVMKYGQNYEGEYEGNTTFTDNYVYTGDGKEGIILWTTGRLTTGGDGGANTAPKAIIDFDVPLVVVDRYSADRLVPCKLLYPTVEYLRKTVQSSKKFTKYVIYKVNADGTRGKNVQEQYNMPDLDVLAAQHCDYEAIPLSLGKTWSDLLKHLNSNDTVYVKPAAFRWFITQVRVNAVSPEDAAKNGGLATDPDSTLGRLEAARKKLEQAKKILVAAGLTNFI